MQRRPWLTVTLLLIVPIGVVAGCLSHDITEPDERVVLDRPAAPEQIDRTIRVRLCGRNGAPQFKLAINAPYTVEDARSGKILHHSDSPLAECDVKPVPGSPRGIQVAFHPLMSDDLRIIPKYDAALIIDGRKYRGALAVVRNEDILRVNNELDVEAYLPSVLAGELPASFHPDAQAALAVAARTYVLWQKQTYGKNRDFDVLPDERSQMYVDVDRVRPVAIEAARRTAGETCQLRGGGLFCTYYSSCCGGRSQSVNNVKRGEREIPPLAGGVVCTTCKDAPTYRWTEFRLSHSELTRRLAARYPSIAQLGTIAAIKIVEESPDGRIIKIRVIGDNGRDESLMAEDFRLSVGPREMRSTKCRIYDDGNGFVFYDGVGFGHGMGLCQYGANGMAKQGKSYQDILLHYYPGCVIEKIK